MTGQQDNDYDAFAEAYAANTESNAYNAYYERPAILAVVGDVAGKRVLDAGCGPGSHAAALQERGAQVTGLDRSAGLLGLAADRLGAGADLHLGDLTEPLPFADASFDVVLASLVMHYLRDWEPTLHEFHRVLTPQGLLALSTHHPFMDHQLSGAEDYFATYEITEQWHAGDHLVPMRFWHRPLRAMTRSLTRTGFALATMDEPEPDPIVQNLDPHAWTSLTTEPRFLFITAHARSPS